MLKYGDTWTNPDPGYKPIDDLLEDAQDKPLATVRVCKEEAQAADMGTVYASGRIKSLPGPPPDARLRPLPLDDAYARAHKGEAISCRSGAAVSLSIDCGCGVGLEHCTPGDGLKGDGRAFVFARQVPLGEQAPLDAIAQSPSDWYKFWWTQEALHFLAAIFKDDRDFRESLTAKWTVVNGPLAQFYRSNAAGFSGKTKAFGMIDDGEPLVAPDAMPTALLPHDVATWELVKDRGQHAAGLLTMPAFLTKYASRRARGAALYNTFLCKSFVSGNVMLMPSTEPNLMVRPGCSTCHATLEPLAAYFARIAETDWRHLPATSFPIESPKCKKDATGKAPAFCRDFYDPAFSTEAFGLLRGAYASRAHVEAGAVGAGAAITAAPEFGACVVDRVASSFLGRPLDADDTALLAMLVETFEKNGHRLRPLVRALVRSSAYRYANPLKAASK